MAAAAEAAASASWMRRSACQRLEGQAGARPGAGAGALEGEHSIISLCSWALGKLTWLKCEPCLLVAQVRALPTRCSVAQFWPASTCSFKAICEEAVRRAPVMPVWPPVPPVSRLRNAVHPLPRAGSSRAAAALAAAHSRA